MADVLSGTNNLVSLPQHQEDDLFESEEGGDELDKSNNVNSISDIVTLNKQKGQGNILNENQENNLGNPSTKRKMEKLLDSSLTSSNASPETKKLNVDENEDGNKDKTEQTNGDGKTNGNENENANANANRNANRNANSNINVPIGKGS